MLVSNAKFYDKESLDLAAKIKLAKAMQTTVKSL